MSDEIFLVQQSIIEDFARKGSCIIVDAAASTVLGNEPGLLRVYIYAPYEVRFKELRGVLRHDRKRSRAGRE